MFIGLSHFYGHNFPCYLKNLPHIFMNKRMDRSLKDEQNTFKIQFVEIFMGNLTFGESIGKRDGSII